jgi:hypothetical protein
MIPAGARIQGGFLRGVLVPFSPVVGVVTVPLDMVFQIPVKLVRPSDRFKSKIHGNLSHYEWIGDNTDHRWE